MKGKRKRMRAIRGVIEKEWEKAEGREAISG